MIHNYIKRSLLMLFIQVFTVLIYANPVSQVQNAIIPASQQKPYLWVYWENLNDAKMPAYIALCRKTFLKHCKDSFNVVELDEKKIHEYLPDLKEKEERFDLKKRFLIQQRVDYYRVLLLEKYGGIYLDADTIIMKDLKEITDKLAEHDFVGFMAINYVDYYGKPENGVMASRPHGILMSKVKENIEKQLATPPDQIKIDYFDFGRNTLHKELSALLASGYKYFHYGSEIDGTKTKDGKNVYMTDKWPIDNDRDNRIFSEQPISYADMSKFFFIVLGNAQIGTGGLQEVFKNHTEEGLLNSKTNFSLLIKRSLGINQ